MVLNDTRHVLYILYQEHSPSQPRFHAGATPHGCDSRVADDTRSLRAILLAGREQRLHAQVNIGVDEGNALFQTLVPVLVLLPLFAACTVEGGLELLHLIPQDSHLRYRLMDVLRHPATNAVAIARQRVVLRQGTVHAGH
jgi:ABC-type thiamine transport system ATPase subunit